MTQCRKCTSAKVIGEGRCWMACFHCRCETTLFFLLCTAFAKECRFYTKKLTFVSNAAGFTLNETILGLIQFRCCHSESFYCCCWSTNEYPGTSLRAKSHLIKSLSAHARIASANDDYISILTHKPRNWINSSSHRKGKNPFPSVAHCTLCRPCVSFTTCKNRKIQICPLIVVHCDRWSLQHRCFLKLCFHWPWAKNKHHQFQYER